MVSTNIAFAKTTTWSGAFVTFIPEPYHIYVWYLPENIMSLLKVSIRLYGYLLPTVKTSFAVARQIEDDDWMAIPSEETVFNLRCRSEDNCSFDLHQVKFRQTKTPGSQPALPCTAFPVDHPVYPILYVGIALSHASDSKVLIISPYQGLGSPLVFLSHKKSASSIVCTLVSHAQNLCGHFSEELLSWRYKPCVRCFFLSTKEKKKKKKRKRKRKEKKHYNTVPTSDDFVPVWFTLNIP